MISFDKKNTFKNMYNISTLCFITTCEKIYAIFLEKKVLQQSNDLPCLDLRALKNALYKESRNWVNITLKIERSISAIVLN